MTKEAIRELLLNLSHELGHPSERLAILGEGNTSARIDGETFWVKASGSCLQTLAADELVSCRFAPLLQMLDRECLSDQEIETELFRCRTDLAARKPSVETLFHAYLLSLPDVNFVGHIHSIPINQILCSPLANKFATCMLFPDEVVCCGGEFALVPYTDPGLALARNIRAHTNAFIQKHETLPRVILLQNHGLITLGKTAAAVKAAILMAHKSAEIFVGATTLGGPVFMAQAEVKRIASRIDEHYRQKELDL